MGQQRLTGSPWVIFISLLCALAFWRKLVTPSQFRITLKFVTKNTVASFSENWKQDTNKSSEKVEIYAMFTSPKPERLTRPVSVAPKSPCFTKITLFAPCYKKLTSPPGHVFLLHNPHKAFLLPPCQTDCSPIATLPEASSMWPGCCTALFARVSLKIILNTLVPTEFSVFVKNIPQKKNVWINA